MLVSKVRRDILCKSLKTKSRLALLSQTVKHSICLKKIKFERTLRNFSQEQFAELAQLSVHGLSNIETGKTDIRYTNLLQIARAFDLRLCELLDFNL